MHDRYRLIQFRPDPFIDTTFTIGALVEHGKQAVFVPSPKIPPVDYVGEKVHAALLVGLDVLGKTEWKTINQMPDTLGPLFLFSVVRNVPMSIVDTVSWVKKLFSNAQEGGT